MNIANITLKVYENCIDESSFTELLFILLYSPHKINSISFKYKGKKTESLSGLINPQSIVSQMKDIYKTFKNNNTYYCNIEINTLLFNFFQYYKELNVLYFTLLEIMTDMRLAIKDLSIVNAKIANLADVMTQHKHLTTLNINNIQIEIVMNDASVMNEIDKLYQCSHLIEGKIKIKFITDSMLDSKVEKELTTLLYSKSKEANCNFVEYDSIKSKFSNTLKYNFDDITTMYRYIDSNRDKLDFNYLYYPATLSFMNKEFFKPIDFACIFSKLKKLQCGLNLNFFNPNDYSDIDFYKIYPLIIETIIDAKFRENNIYSLYERLYYNKHEKRKRRFIKIYKLHKHIFDRPVLINK